MLYYLFDYLEKTYHIPGAGLFQFLTFRAGLAIGFSLLIAAIFGKKIINYLRKKQVGETIRDLGLEGQSRKRRYSNNGRYYHYNGHDYPTLLFAKLENIYVILLLVTTIWMGVIGFIDDYIKIFKKNKEGLSGKFKVIGQVGLGLIVGATMYFHEDITIKRHKEVSEKFN